jgi:hypothetical protein
MSDNRPPLVLTGDAIGFYQLLVWRGALKLEAAGLRRNGPSMYSILKKKGYKGTRNEIVSQLTQEIERQIAAKKATEHDN